MNPFLPWLPLYPPGTVPERPWWRCADPNNLAGPVTRCDGFRIEVRNRARPHAFPQHPLNGPQDWCFVIGDTFHPWPPEPWAADAPNPVILRAALMAQADEAHPLPVPPPMVGQVWVWRSGVTRAIVATAPGWHASNIGAGEDKDWPYDGAVLVAGPSPWGRDVPWAPPGWRP
jgi:hypothetical protein